MNITFFSNPKELRKVRLEVEIYCKSNLPNLDTSKVILALDEALQNIIRHAYNMKTDQKIDINIDSLDETSLKLRNNRLRQTSTFRHNCTKKLRRCKTWRLRSLFY